MKKFHCKTYTPSHDDPSPCGTNTETLTRTQEMNLSWSDPIQQLPIVALKLEQMYEFCFASSVMLSLTLVTMTA